MMIVKQPLFRAGRCLLPALLLLISITANAQRQTPGLELIDGDELIKTVTFLASPELDGRQPGSPGYLKAAEYMASNFASLGLKDPTGDFYFQNLKIEYVNISETPEFSLILPDQTVTNLSLGQDFVCRGITGFGDIKGPIVFCGYGISEPDAAYDDYADIDVKGKIVLVFKQNPPFKIEGVDLSNKYNRYRANMAAKHGAIGLILISTPLSKNPQLPIGSIMDGEGTYEAEIPQVHIHLDRADELMMGLKMDLSELQQKIDSLHQPASVYLKTRASIKVTGSYTPDQTSMNVVGILPGSDSLLKNEYVVISAHLDHVGRQGPSLYFPGANDNASGSAAVLQLARAYAGIKPAPKRSIIFVLYTSEEQGLTGSAWFAEHCPVNTEKIVAALNMDCIAYGDSIQIGNGESNPELWNLARKQDSLHANLTVDRTWKGGGADLDGLHKKAVPGLYFVTTRSYDHLHLPSDVPSTLNIDLYTELVRLVFRVSQEISNGNYIRENVETRK